MKTISMPFNHSRHTPDNHNLHIAHLVRLSIAPLVRDIYRSTGNLSLWFVCILNSIARRQRSKVSDISQGHGRETIFVLALADDDFHVGLPNTAIDSISLR